MRWVSSTDVLLVSSCILLTKPLILFSFQNMLRGDVKGVSIYKPLLSVYGLIQADVLKGPRSWCQHPVISGQLLKGKGAFNFQLCLQELSVCGVSLWLVWWETWPLLFHGPSPSSELDFFPFFARGYRCPLCMHSALDMRRYWRQLDDEVAQTPMPTEYQNIMVEVRDRCMPLLLADCISPVLAVEGSRNLSWIRSQPDSGNDKELSCVSLWCDLLDL